MKILRVHAEDFLSLGHVSYTYEHGRVTVVTGKNLDDQHATSNGSGKSSFLEAIMWVLYGSLVRGSKSVSDVVRRGAAKCEVSVDIEAVGSVYRVTRSRAVGSKGLRLIFEQVSPEAHDLTLYKADDTQRAISEFIGMSEDDFRVMCYMEGALQSKFSSLADTARKAFLEDMLGSSTWDQATRAARKHHRELEIQESSAVGSRDSTESSLKMLEESTRTGATQDLIVDLERQVRAYEEETARLPEIVAQEADALTLREDLRGSLFAASQMQARVEAEVQDFTSRLEELRSSEVRDSCPTCGSQLSPDKVEETRQHILEETSVMSQSLEASTLNLSSLKKQYADLVSEFTEADARLTMLTKEHLRLEGSVQSWKSVLRNLEAHRESARNLESHRQRLLDQLAADEAHLSSIRDDLRYAKFWVDQFPQLRASVLKQYLDVLNRVLLEYCSVASVSERISFVMTDDKIEMEFTYDGTPVVFSTRSSGERRRMDLVIQLALRRLSSLVKSQSPPLLVLDEVLDTLDAVGVQTVVSLLKYINSKDPQVILLTSHADHVASEFQDHASVVVTKRAGVSSVQTT